MHRRVLSLAAAVAVSSGSALLLGIGSASAEPTVPHVPDVSGGGLPQNAIQVPNTPSIPSPPAPNELQPGLPELPLELTQLLDIIDIPTNTPNPLEIAKDACENVVDLVDDLAPPDLSQFKKLCGLLDLPIGVPGLPGHNGNDGDDGKDGDEHKLPVPDVGSQVTLVPAGAVDTGDGSSTGDGEGPGVGLLAGALALAGTGGTAAVLRRRTQRDS